MEWEEFLHTEPNGQKFMTRSEAERFMRLYPTRCHPSDRDVGLPDVVVLDRPHKVRAVRAMDLCWLEVMRMKDLRPWPPTFGPSYEAGECDPNIFEVELAGGRVIDGAGTHLLIEGRYDGRRVETALPCSPELLARCGAATLESLRGRLVMEIGEQEFVGPESRT